MVLLLRQNNVLIPLKILDVLEHNKVVIHFHNRVHLSFEYIIFLRYQQIQVKLVSILLNEHQYFNKKYRSIICLLEDKVFQLKQITLYQLEVQYF